jgi:hypothetical protein
MADLPGKTWIVIWGYHLKIDGGRNWIEALLCSHTGPSSLHRDSEEHEIPSTSRACAEDL